MGTLESRRAWERSEDRADGEIEAKRLMVGWGPQDSRPSPGRSFPWQPGLLGAVWPLALPHPSLHHKPPPFFLSFFFFLIILPVTSLSGDGIPSPCPSPQQYWTWRPWGNSGTEPLPPGSAPEAAASHHGHHRLCGLRRGAGGYLGQMLDPWWVVELGDQASTAPAPPGPLSLLHCSYGSGPEGWGVEDSQGIHRPLGPVLTESLF